MTHSLPTNWSVATHTVQGYLREVWFPGEFPNALPLLSYSFHVSLYLCSTVCPFYILPRPPLSPAHAACWVARQSRNMDRVFSAACCRGLQCLACTSSTRFVWDYNTVLGCQWTVLYCTICYSTVQHITDAELPEQTLQLASLSHDNEPS